MINYIFLTNISVCKLDLIMYYDEILNKILKINV